MTTSAPSCSALDHDRGAGGRVLRGVAEDVAQDLLHVRRLAGHDREERRSTSSIDAERRQLGASLPDDPLEQAAGLEGFGLHDEPAAFDPAQHEQVLDEPVQALRFGPDVGEQRGRAAAGRRPDPAATGSRSGPRIVVIGVRSSWLMTSMKASRNSPARRSSASRRSRSSSSCRRSVMSWPVPIIRIGRPCVVAEDPARHRGSSGPLPSGQSSRNSRSKVAGPGDGRLDRRRNRSAVVLMDHPEVGREVRRLGRRLEPVLLEDRVGPGQPSARDVPFPEAGPRCRQHDLKAAIPRLDLIGEVRDVGQGRDQPVARRAPR